jgi:hypothetical protein
MIVPTITYSSVVWLASKTDMRAIEAVQRRCSKWVLNYADMSYKERFFKLNLLPLSLNLQIIDLLTLSKIVNSSYDFDWSPHLRFYRGNQYSTRSSSRQIFEVDAVIKERFRQNFWYRTSRLANFLPSDTDFLNITGLKQRLLKLFWSYFTRRYDEDIPCSWRIGCTCTRCRETNPKLDELTG